MNRLTTLVGVLALAAVQTVYAGRMAKFPNELRFTAIDEGTATVAWTVAPDGRIEDTVVLEATHPAFAKSALEAVPRRLPPDLKASLPRYESATFVFKRTGGAIQGYSSIGELEWEKERERRTVTPTITVGADDLHEPLRQTGGEASVCPGKRTMLEGAATVRFVIDDEGRVRVPRIVDSTSSDFAATMLSAVKQWRFSTPMVDGRPVQVEDTQAFVVSPTDACVVFKPKARAQFAVR